MNISRRSFLGLAGVASALSTGCVGASGGNGRSGSTDDGNRGSATPSDGSTARLEGSSSTTTEDGSELHVSATADESKSEYVESENAVRYVAGYEYVNSDAIENGSPPTREPTYRTIPFDRWARIECASSGAEGLRKHLSERLGSEIRGINVGVRTRGAIKTIVVTRVTTLDRDGEVTATPSASEERLNRLAPSAVVATVSLADRRHTCTVPVTTKNVTEHLE